MSPSSPQNWKDALLLREMQLFQAVAPANKGLGPRAPLPDYEDPKDAQVWALAEDAARAHMRAHRAEARMEKMFSRWWVAALMAAAYLCGLLAGGWR